MHFASLLSIQDKISSMEWKGMWIGLDGEPPELIIVYYSAGADVNIHTTGHFPLSIFARVCIPPANGVCGSGCAFFCQKLRICHTFELPSGNWLQHCSAETSRWHKGSTQQCKLAGRKFEGVSDKSAWRLNTRPRTFHSNVSNVHLFTRLDTLRLPPGWLCKFSPWKWLYIKAVLTYSSPLWRQIGAKRAQTHIHNHSTSF